MRTIIIALFALATLTGCVSKKKYIELQASQDAMRQTLQQSLTECQGQLGQLQTTLNLKESDLQARMREIQSQNLELTDKRNQLKVLQDQLDLLKNTNTNLLQRMEDLSVISKSGAESITKSLQAINDQSRYIQDLTSKIQQKDSVNLVLVMNLKRSLADVNDEDVTVEVKKGVVYISLSDKLLFKSGSSDISDRADVVLGKVAKVINDHNEIEILVEGHTDNVPINNTYNKDNWDLSVHRATAVVRLLQNKYKVSPNRMTAGGRGEYLPKTTNDTANNRQINRRTEIIITPKLDQFFELLTPPSPPKN